MRSLNIFLLFLLSLNAYFYIFGNNGFAKKSTITEMISEQREANNKTLDYNYFEQQRVNLLRSSDPDSYESYARRNLNYIKPGEIFFRILDTEILPSYEYKNKKASITIDRSLEVKLHKYELQINI